MSGWLIAGGVFFVMTVIVIGLLLSAKDAWEGPNGMRYGESGPPLDLVRIDDERNN